MCLLDGVIEWDDDSIFCVSETHQDPANPLRRADQLGAMHAFEYGAQAAAIHGGLRAREQGGVAPPGYLAALRDGQLYVDRLDNILVPVHVRGRRLFGTGVDTVYECQVSANDQLLASGRVTIMLRPR